MLLFWTFYLKKQFWNKINYGFHKNIKQHNCLIFDNKKY